MIISQAVLIAVAVDGEGRRQILGVDLANRESRTSWRDFLLALNARGLFGVQFAVSDDHEGLKQAIREVLPGAAWQRCYVHFLRNALDHLPRKLADDCLQELRWIYDRRELVEVRRATSPPGSPSGRPSIPSSAIGSKRTSRRRSLTTACRSPITST